MAHLLNSTSDAAPQRGSKFGFIIIENSGNYKGNLIPVSYTHLTLPTSDLV